MAWHERKQKLRANTWFGRKWQDHLWPPLTELSIKECPGPLQCFCLIRLMWTCFAGFRFPLVCFSEMQRFQHFSAFFLCKSEAYDPILEPKNGIESNFGGVLRPPPVGFHFRNYVWGSQMVRQDARNGVQDEKLERIPMDPSKVFSARIYQARILEMDPPGLMIWLLKNHRS